MRGFSRNEVVRLVAHFFVGIPILTVAIYFLERPSLFLSFVAGVGFSAVAVGVVALARLYEDKSVREDNDDTL